MKSVAWILILTECLLYSGLWAAPIERNEIAVTVTARDVRDDGKILRYYLTVEGVGVTDRRLKEAEAQLYPALRALELPGKVGSPLLTDRVGIERTEAGYFWQGVRIWQIYNANQMSERQLAFYRREIEAIGYRVRPFRFPIEEMEREDFERVESAAVTEARRQAERIAKARGVELGPILETEWLNSEVGDGTEETIRLRVVFAAGGAI